MTVGLEIRRLREEKGWSQAKLGVLAGTGPSGISQIETGRRNPNAGTLQRIADALGVEVRDLFPLEQPRLPESQWWTLLPPGQAYFQEPREGEEEETVTLRLYVWRELENDDPLLQKVAKLIRDERDKAKAEAG